MRTGPGMENRRALMIGIPLKSVKNKRVWPFELYIGMV